MTTWRNGWDRGWSRLWASTETRLAYFLHQCYSNNLNLPSCTSPSQASLWILSFMFSFAGNFLWSFPLAMAITPGRNGEVTYPVSISCSIDDDWPKGVAAWEPIFRQHDLDMLEDYRNWIVYVLSLDISYSSPTLSYDKHLKYPSI